MYDLTCPSEMLVLRSVRDPERERVGKAPLQPKLMPVPRVMGRAIHV
jgi:hypothetical protein